MKLLLCISSLNDLKAFFENSSVQPQISTKFSFLHSAKILHHEVDIIETGAGVYQTAYKVTRILAAQKYLLAIKVSFGNAFKDELIPGSVLNIINEKPGDTGIMINQEWKDHYDLGLLKREDEPHVRGGFINLTNAYMNIFGAYKKVVGITVNHYADKDSLHLKREKYKADCETGDGLGFVYPCLFEKQPFYQLCVIERNLASGEENIALAQKVLNEILIDLMKKL